jgi:hypothetical protein
MPKKKNEDPVLREFEERDLGDDVRASGSMLRSKRNKQTSIVLEPDLIADLRAAGAKRGLRYQTMLKLILREHVKDYK